MRHLIKYLWGFLFILSCQFVSAVNPPDSTEVIFKSHELNTDPLTGRRYFGTFKISTLQVLFSEAPFTFEVFLRNDFSMQLQAGIIFPLESDSFLEQFFRSAGPNSTASSNALISYRNSPYNNHGLSIKYELRKYQSTFYYAPQLMYKICRYDEQEFPVSIENRKMKQTESKYSRIFGVGLMLGRQTYFMKQATDWYIGVGVRRRQTSATLLKIEDTSSPSKVIYPETQEVSTKVYPFVNFGFRLGLVL